MQNTRYTVRKVQKLLQKTAETCEKSYKRCKMTDKPIIIDGVDVSGCDFLCNGKFWCEAHKILVNTKKMLKGDGLIACNEKYNCDYKQLQRDKAVFRAYHDRDQNEITRLYGELQRKTAECERCKQALEEIEEIVNVTHFQTLPLHRGSTHYLADKYDEARDKILYIISKARE